MCCFGMQLYEHGAVEDEVKEVIANDVFGKLLGESEKNPETSETCFTLRACGSGPWPLATLGKP